MLMKMQPEHAAELCSLLRNMDACARNLEQIGERELLAARHLDADTLSQLADLRARSHQAMQAMEAQTRKLLARCGAPPEMSLSTFIDLHTPEDADNDTINELQALRRNLYQRMLSVHASGNESRLYLKAAHDVAVGVLQHIGAIETKQTYGPRRP
ncbi:MAG: hypothetical protein AUK36_01700 [Zetaproteobacteria bacterium CG2_30_59_37]|nr:MAG: hypothetical protein AUK36_01700 [Zetaproteobacteria bacterium CG2_30_59_37]